VLSKFRAFVVKGFDLAVQNWKQGKLEGTPYHENTLRQAQGKLTGENTKEEGVT
jgi:hypothetical protein